MDSFIYHNDGVVPLGEARLSPGQAGLLMGWGVFTTLRLYRGIPFAFDRHWARISRDAARLSVPLGRNEAETRRAVMELAEANHRQDGTARLLFVRNQAGMWSESGQCPPTDLLILTREVTAWPAAHRLELGPRAVVSQGPFAGIKGLSWVVPSVLYEQAHLRGLDDALLLNERGDLAECTSANFFAVRGETVLTPPLSSGCLPGITREILLEIGPRNGIAFKEVDLTVADLASFDEVFISSTTREGAPVASISPEHSYTAPGNISQRLEALFRAYVESWLLSQ